MTEGAAEHRRMRLDVHLHLAGEDRAYLAGLLLGVESRSGVATPTRGRGLSTFIKAFCVAALVAVVAGESYRAGGAASAARIIATEAGPMGKPSPNPDAPFAPGEIPPAFARGLQLPPQITPPPGTPVSADRASGPAAFGLKE